MSMKERRRLSIFSQVVVGAMSLVCAASSLGISYRQAKRLCSRYRREGDSGLLHGLRGRPGNRRVDESLRSRAVELYRRHYGDFGCTLACEYLAERHGLAVDDQTLCRWLKAAGLWRRRRRGSAKRHRRPRRLCFGELVQLDGSHHDWFEGRSSRCVLMVMVDDATGWTLARFFEAETTAAAMTMLRCWALAHGLPLELYPDQDSIYRVNTAAADELEARTGKRPLTQFGRAMSELGVKLTCAKSPQAKGRVERMNGTLQDRLVKALRVEGLRDMEAANAYLEQTFLPRLNARFAQAPADSLDRHLPTTVEQLDQALCLKEQRTAGGDQCLSFQGQVLQLTPGRGTPSLAGKIVTVRQSLDGSVTVQWRGQVIAHRPLAKRPTTGKPALQQRVAQHQPAWKPPASHPWRQDQRTSGSTVPHPPPPVGPGSAPVRAAPSPPLRQAQPA